MTALGGRRQREKAASGGKNRACGTGVCYFTYPPASPHILIMIDMMLMLFSYLSYASLFPLIFGLDALARVRRLEPFVCAQRHTETTVDPFPSTLQSWLIRVRHNTLAARTEGMHDIAWRRQSNGGQWTAAQSAHPPPAYFPVSLLPHCCCIRTRWCVWQQVPHDPWSACWLRDELR